MADAETLEVVLVPLVVLLMVMLPEVLLVMLLLVLVLVVLTGTWIVTFLDLVTLTYITEVVL